MLRFSISIIPPTSESKFSQFSHQILAIFKANSQICRIFYQQYLLFKTNAYFLYFHHLSNIINTQILHQQYSFLKANSQIFINTIPTHLEQQILGFFINNTYFLTQTPNISILSPVSYDKSSHFASALLTSEAKAHICHILHQQYFISSFLFKINAYFLYLHRPFHTINTHILHQQYSSQKHILEAKAHIFHQHRPSQKQTLIFPILTAKNYSKFTDHIQIPPFFQPPTTLQLLRCNSSHQISLLIRQGRKWLGFLAASKLLNSRNSAQSRWGYGTSTQVRVKSRVE